MPYWIAIALTAGALFYFLCCVVYFVALVIQYRDINFQSRKQKIDYLALVGLEFTLAPIFILLFFIERAVVFREL